MRDIVRRYLPPDLQGPFDELDDELYFLYLVKLWSYWDGGCVDGPGWYGYLLGTLEHRGCPRNLAHALANLRGSRGMRNEIDAERQRILARFEKPPAEPIELIPAPPEIWKGLGILSLTQGQLEMIQQHGLVDGEGEYIGDTLMIIHGGLRWYLPMRGGWSYANYYP